MSASQSRFFERVFKGQKISGLDFKISGSDFEIRAINFFFAPMRGKRSENQFSIFDSKKRRFLRPKFSHFLSRLQECPTGIFYLELSRLYPSLVRL